MTPAVPTFDAYADDRPEARFSAWLREAATDEWEAMCSHRFVEQMATDDVPPPVFEAYLLQEYAFVDTSARALGHAVAAAPSMTERRTLTAALDGLVTDQRAYFERAFDALGVPEERWRDPDLRPATRRFRDLVLRAAATGGYVETLAPMLAAEWLYATWCADAAETAPTDTLAGEWVHLHDTEEFREHADWLRDQVDDLGPTLPPHRERRVRELFRRTLAAERAFHDAPYDAADR